MLDHFPRELAVGLSGPMCSMPGLGNAVIVLRLFSKLSFARPLQACLGWVRGSHPTPWVAAAMLSLLTVTGCAEVPGDPQERAALEQTNDPAEPANRAIFEGNQSA